MSNGFNTDFGFDSIDFDGGFGVNNNNNTGGDFDSFSSFDSGQSFTDQTFTNNDSLGMGINQNDNFVSDANSDNNPFGGQFDNSSDSDPLAVQNGKSTSAYAIIFVVIGIIAVILVFLLASKINKISKEPAKQSVVQTQTTQNYTQPNIQTQNANVNVDNTLGDSYDSKPNASISTSKSNSENWIEITSGENVSFNNEYSEMTFTITEIKHLTRLVDTNSNLVVKTRLRGSISGLSGTYELDVPYNKGVKLVVGNNFTVHVQLGTFNDKTVVGEIRY